MNIDSEIIKKCKLLEEYTDMTLEEFNNYLSQALDRIPNDDKEQILSHNLNIIFGLDFRKYQLNQSQKRNIFRPPPIDLSPDPDDYSQILYQNTVDDDVNSKGGFTVPKSDETTLVVGINLYYRETVDILGHEFAHIWYNHRQDTNNYQPRWEINEQEAKAKAKYWGFKPEICFTPRTRGRCKVI